MTASKLTDKQRTALQAVQAARASGLALSAYARANGLNVRQVHDSVRALRRLGLLPPTSVPRRRGVAARRAFAVVDVMSSPTMTRSGMVCRLIHRGGLVIECGEWPPAGWLSALMAERTGAAA